MCLVMVALFFVFFFIDTATTEIYTYVHTLSRHDALPIYRPRSRRSGGGGLRDPGGGARSVAGRTARRRRSRHPRGHSAPADAQRTTVKERSEEHTSELQSLMRISYAVFCLKKQNEYMRCTIDTRVSHTIVV